MQTFSAKRTSGRQLSGNFRSSPSRPHLADNFLIPETAADPFPTLPLDFTWAISRRWAFTGHADYMKAHLSQFSGWISNVHEELQYRWNPNFAVALGYTSIRTSYDRSSGSFSGAFYMSYNGPAALIRFSF